MKRTRSSNLTTVYAADGSSLTTGSQSGSDSASGTADYESEGSWSSHFDYTGSDFSRSETSSGTDTVIGSDGYNYSHSWSVTYNADGTVTSSDSVSNNVSGGGSRTHTWTTNWTQTQPSAGSSGSSTTGTTGGSTSTTGTTSGSTSTTGSTGGSSTGSTSGSGSTTGTTGTSSPSTVTFSGSDSGSETTDATYADVVLTAGFAGIAYARGPALGLGIADYLAPSGNEAAEGNASGGADRSNDSSSSESQDTSGDNTQSATSNTADSGSNTSNTSFDDEHCAPSDAAHSMDDLTGIPWDIWTALQGNDHKWWVVILVDQPKPDSDDNINVRTGETGHGFICLVNLQDGYQDTYDNSYCIGFAGMSGTGVIPVEGYLKNDSERWWTIAMGMPVSEDVLESIKKYYEDQLKLHEQHKLMYSLAHLNCVSMLLNALWGVGIDIFPETDPILCGRATCRPPRLPWWVPFRTAHQGYAPGDLGWYIRKWGELWPGAIVIRNPYL